MTSLESALQKITPLIVDGNRYLPQAAVLQVASQLCYPTGSQSSDPRQQHLDEIEVALTALGYGDLVELAPPAVDADQRGSYYQALPTIDLETITRIVAAITPHALSIPYTGHDCRRLWKSIALTLWQTAYADLPPARQQFLANQVDAHMQALGWQWREGMEERVIPSGRAYLQQLVPDYEKMAEELADILTGSPVPAHQVMLAGLRGAFHY
ncbi:MAG: hypothetical protein KDE34_23865, partial [Anaerolineales bacterium]|nr:hypothetical protein [Anaerolineales bacterium]